MSDLQRQHVLAKLGEHQVFGAPVQRGGTTPVPVAQVRAAAGLAGGNGRGGVVARPVGAWSVGEGGAVNWHPAADVNHIVRGGQVALAAVFIAVAFAFRRRR